MSIMNKILHSVFEVIYTAGAVQTSVRMSDSSQPIDRKERLE